MSRSILYVICFVLLAIFGHIHAQANVACIGNSITQGLGIPNPNDTYPAKLEMLLGSGYTVTNYGEAGRTALDVDEWSYILSPVWTYSKAIPHDIVIILLGTNDSKEEYWTEYANFKDDYLYIMNSYKNYPGSDDPVFILGLPPPVFDESQGHKNAPIVNDIIPRIKQLSNETDATIADFYNALAGKPELFMDGVHPNEVGAGIMAQIAFNAIQEALYTADPPPATPTGLKTIPGLSNITLEWHANTEDDLFSYRIFRSMNEGGVQDYIGEILKPSTTFTDYNVILNHIYYYSIDAKDVHNNVSSRTAAVAGKTIDNIPPSAPLNLQATLAVDSVKINWTPNSEPDLEKYHIYRNTNLSELQNASSIVGTVHEPKSNFNDLTFSSATNYYYVVKAVDISGNQGLISNIVNITTKSRPLSSDTTLTFYEDTPHQFTASDFPFTDADNHTLDKIIFIESTHNEFFTYDNDTIGNSVTCDDISKLLFTPDSNEFGDSYTAFAFKVVDSFGSTSLDTNIVRINVASVNDAPNIDPIEDIFTIEDSSAIILSITGMSVGRKMKFRTYLYLHIPMIQLVLK